MTPEQLVRLAQHRQTTKPIREGAKPAEKLATLIEGVTSGRIYSAKLPWPQLHNLTLALMPGAMTVLCGDPGVGKTYFLLDCLRFWTQENIDSAVYFLEEDETFYLRRLLAQEEGKSEYGRLDFWKENPELVQNAMEKHARTINELGTRITVAENTKQMELRQITAWLEEQLKTGRRVIAIDPITAAYAGADRWLADDAFVMETKGLITRYGASLILVTHPRKGNVVKKSGHDMGGGAAYFRFSSTSLWLNRLKKPKRFTVYGPCGPDVVDTDTLIEIHKARESKGTGQEIAVQFGDGLHYTELGVVTGESDEQPDGQQQAMKSQELDKAIKLLNQKFPQQLNQSQGQSIRRAFAPFSFATVSRVIDNYYYNSDKLNVPEFLAKLSA